MMPTVAPNGLRGRGAGGFSMPSDAPVLLRQASGAQRFGQRLSDRWYGIDCRAPFADPEIWLEGDHARCGGLRLVYPPKLPKHPCQKHVRDAEARIALDRLAHRIGRVLVAPLLEISEVHRMPRHPVPRVERAQAQPFFSP